MRRAPRAGTVPFRVANRRRSTGGKIGEIKDELKFVDKISDRVAEMFAKRSDGGITVVLFAVLLQDSSLGVVDILMPGFGQRRNPDVYIRPGIEAL
jgi:hypothetical protein